MNFEIKQDDGKTEPSDTMPGKGIKSPIKDKKVSTSTTLKHFI